MPEVVGHLATLGQRVVEGEHVRHLNRPAGLNEIRDATAQLVQTVLVGGSIFKRMVVAIDADFLKNPFVVKDNDVRGRGYRFELIPER